jgi:dihydrolipoamide dehydrogenase
MVEALDRVLPSVDERLTRPVLRRLRELGVDLRLRTRRGASRVATCLLEGPDGPGARPGRARRRGRRAPAEHGHPRVEARPHPRRPGRAHPRRPPAARVAHGLRGRGRHRGPALAHKASAEGRVAAEALCGLPAAFDPSAIPQVVFTQPEIATAGLTEEQAREAGMDAEARQVPLGASGRAATLGARDGFAQVVLDRATERVVGVHLVAPHASELIAEGVLAVELLAGPEDLRGTIHPHPTLSELLHDAVGVERPPVARAARGPVRSRTYELRDPRL